MAGTGKPDIWLVDDLKSNRDEFRKEHSKHFRMRSDDALRFFRFKIA